MNNTTTGKLTAIVAVLMAATLVVGIFATTTTLTQTALAYSQKKKDNGKEGNDNGNTVTIEECKNRGSASGFDTALDQECENLICTHPGDNATCTQEGVRSTPTSTPTPEPITTTLRVIKKVDCLPTDPNCSPNCRIDVIRPFLNIPPIQSFNCQAAIGNGVLVTLQPGDEFFIEEVQPGPPFFGVTFEGDCGSPLKPSTIAAGQHLTCTITNIEPEEG
jgi:hypothetical protein